MNERIKELAMSVQCERHWTEEDIEKFAELIVRECADVADCTGMAFPVNGWVVGDKIRKHFGVEE